MKGGNFEYYNKTEITVNKKFITEYGVVGKILLNCNSQDY